MRTRRRVDVLELVDAQVAEACLHSLREGGIDVKAVRGLGHEVVEAELKR